MPAARALEVTETVYREADLQRLRPIIHAAQQLWDHEIASHLAQHGDQGSCVYGAGIVVPYLRPRARVVRACFILRPGGAQGSLTWESSVDRVLAFLHEQGVTGCSYRPGWMH